VGTADAFSARRAQRQDTCGQGGGRGGTLGRVRPAKIADDDIIAGRGFTPTGDHDEDGTRWGMYDARDQLSSWPRGVMALRGRGSYLQLVASPGVV